MTDYTENLKKSIFAAQKTLVQKIHDEIERLNAANREAIIRMLEEVGLWRILEVQALLPHLERFADLVAAEKEQQMIRDGWRRCAVNQRTTQFCGLLDAAVKAEREACVELCLEHSKLNVDDANVEFSHLASYEFGKQVGAATCATAIRARGET